MTKSFGKRQRKRTRAVLSVRVQRQDGTSALAHTLDITYIGTRLGGLRMLLSGGEPLPCKEAVSVTTFEWFGLAGLAPESTRRAWRR